MGVLSLYCVGFIFVLSGCVAAGSSIPPDTAISATVMAVVGPPTLDALAIIFVPDYLAVKRRPKKKRPASRGGKRTPLRR